MMRDSLDVPSDILLTSVYAYLYSLHSTVRYILSDPVSVVALVSLCSACGRALF